MPRRVKKSDYKNPLVNPDDERDVPPMPRGKGGLWKEPEEDPLEAAVEWLARDLLPYKGLVFDREEAVWAWVPQEIDYGYSLQSEED
ncbi:hypothetical protein JCM8097_003827 [Rhodosporidiobolus ruineniae]